MSHSNIIHRFILYNTYIYLIYRKINYTLRNDILSTAIIPYININSLIGPFHIFRSAALTNQSIALNKYEPNSWKICHQNAYKIYMSMYVYLSSHIIRKMLEYERVRCAHYCHTYMRAGYIKSFYTNTNIHRAPQKTRYNTFLDFITWKDDRRQNNRT